MDIADDGDGEEDDGHAANNNYKEFTWFIEHINKNCIKLGVAPAIIPSWIKDLRDSKSLIDIDKKEDI